MLKIDHVHHVRDHVLHLRFNNGTEGEVDLMEELTGPIFVPLRDVNVFRQVFLHPETRTVAWPNGADFAAEFLLSLMGTGATNR